MATSSWYTVRIAYPNGARFLMGYLWATFPFVWDFEIALRHAPGAKPFHFFEHPGTHGFGPGVIPPCVVPPQWQWIQVIAPIFPFGLKEHSQSWLFADCSRVFEMAAWLRREPMQPRSYLVEVLSQAAA